MTKFNAAEFSACAAPYPISKWRWAGSLLLGIVLYLAVAIVSQSAPVVLLGLPLEGLTFAIVGVIQLLCGVVAISLALKIVQLNFRDVGFVTEHWCSDVFIGAAVAVVFAVIQFLLIIPGTGGMERSDVAVHIAQLGNSGWGPLGFIVLAWTSVFFEELFIRGLVFNSLRELWGSSRVALFLSVTITATIFAAFHGYQGWAGVVDTGLYGGLALTLLYVWRGRLTACIVAHALWNTIATVGVYLWYF
jgi:hypothetical protein